MPSAVQGNVIGLTELLQNKRASARPQDLADVDALDAFSVSSASKGLRNAKRGASFSSSSARESETSPKTGARASEHHGVGARSKPMPPDFALVI
jgi:hypothetical protein